MAVPIYVADNIVKMKACRNATSNSSVIMNKESGTEAMIPVIEPVIFLPASPNIKIRLTKLRITMWPAVMLAKRRNSRVNGFRKRPRISMAVRMKIFRTAGTPGIHKVCSQKCFFALNVEIKNVSRASTMVMEILPVTLAPPGKKGI